MLLRDTSASLRLTVTGYQFPFAAEPERRFSRHVVEGEAHTPAGGWRFRYPALNCDESPMIGMWLTTVADWLSDSGDELAPPRLDFSEQNFSFAIARREDDQAILTVDLLHEFRPPWQRTAETPRFALELTQGVAALRRAAAAWSAETRAYPDGRDPVGDGHR